MNLLVIGHSVVDYINFNQTNTIKQGGISYTVTALNNYKDTKDKISLITAVDNEHYNLFKKEYEKLESKLFNYVEKVPKVWLKIEKYSERHEKYENITQNLEFKINDMNKYDGILINMITGFDITLEQLKHIRKNYNGLIYFDVHTFSRGLDENFRRQFRIIPSFNEWASNLDIIQVNKHELKTLNNKQKEENIIEEVLNCGTKYLIITLEDEGAIIFFKDAGKIKSISGSALTVNVKNKIGCGDVFGAIFFYSYISGGKEISEVKKISAALKRANIAAGCAASYSKISEFKNLKEDVRSRNN